MCRFVHYLGEEIGVSQLLIEPSNSLIHRSFHSHERTERLNGDGFGLAWYPPGDGAEPALFRDVTPAWNNANLFNLARVTQSRCVLAHVRAATPGLPVMQLNCHPFCHGRLSFMHNGEISGFAEVRRPLLEGLSPEAFRLIRGSTDTEHIFALFVDQLHRLKPATGDRFEAMERALNATIGEVEELCGRAGAGPCSLNLLVSDGCCSVATSYVGSADSQPNTLYLHSGRRYECADGVCRMVEAGAGEGAVIIASEPLSRDAGWQPVARNHLVVVRPDLATSVEPIG